MHWQFGPIRLIRISYYGIFALTESLEGFGRGNPTARPEATAKE